MNALWRLWRHVTDTSQLFLCRHLVWLLPRDPIKERKPRAHHTVDCPLLNVSCRWLLDGSLVTNLNIGFVLLVLSGQVGSERVFKAHSWRGPRTFFCLVKSGSKEQLWSVRDMSPAILNRERLCPARSQWTSRPFQRLQTISSSFAWFKPRNLLMTAR